METFESISGNKVSKALVVLPVFVAALAAAGSGALSGISLKLLAGVVMAGLLLVIGIRTGKTKSILLGGFAFSLTYNRQYFVFERITGHQGAYGPYLVVADAFLLLLVLNWIFEAVFLKERRKPGSESSGIAWLVPFMAVSAVAGILAVHPAWSFFEMLRLVRIAVLLIYFHYHVGKSEWWAVITGIGLAAFAQGAMGVAEVATGRSGVLGVLGFGNLESLAPPELRQDVFYGWRRATGTMSHPPNLACYFLMAIPPMVALGFMARTHWRRFTALVVAGVSLAGLACTLSRWPIAVMAFQLPLIVVGMVALRLIELRRAIGTLALTAFCVVLMAFSMRDFIADRLTRDLDRSVDFRVQENETGMKVARLSPIWGVGPNNYGEYLYQLEPSWAWARQYEDISISLLHIRPIASPHDGFLLILAETGLLGLAAFIIFLIGVFRSAIRAIARTHDVARATCWGLLVGFIGLLLQQAVDFSIWADPLLYTLGLMAGLFCAAPVQTRAPEVAQP